MTVEWLEHVDLPEGQAVDLLRRYPYERASQIELANEHDRALTQMLLAEGGSKEAVVLRTTTTGFADAVVRASLWTAAPAECDKRHSLKHGLTGAEITPSQIGMVADPIAKALREKAIDNYNAWYDEAYPGPKDSGETDSQTPSTATPESSDPMTPEQTLSETAG